MDLARYLSHHPKKYLIFDLDHTLAKMNIDWSTIRRDVFDFIATFDEQLSKSIPFEPYMWIQLSNLAAKKYGATTAKKIRSFIEEYEITHYKNYTPNTILLNFIRDNKQTYTYYLWTNNGTKTIQEFLKKEVIAPFFSQIITQNDVSLIKPEPEGFSHIYTRGESPSTYVLIGDNFTDEEAAEKAGIDFYKVNYFSRQ